MFRVLLIWLCAVLMLACSGEEKSMNDEAGEEVLNVDPSSALDMSQSEEINSADIDSTLEKLNSDFAKVAFLREIMLEDQRVRKEESDILQQYGYESAQHKAAIEALIATDELNLVKVDKFTEKFGAPKENSVGRMQAEAIWYVIHHSQGVDARSRYFDILTQAYETSAISGGQYTLYLNRWYERESGERLIMEGSYTEEAEIAKLHELLGV